MPPKKSTNRAFTADEVARHRYAGDIYVVIRDKVYDVSSFVDEHPGGMEALLDQGGKDATEAFEEVSHSKEAEKILAGFQIGVLRRQTGDEEILGSKRGRASDAYATGRTGQRFELYIVLLSLLVAGYGAWSYLDNKDAFFD